MTDYSKIDGNRKATFKQLNGVAAKFCTLLQKTLNVPEDSPITGKRLYGRTRAVICKAHAKSKLGFVTHSDIQRYFKMDAVPESIAKAVKTSDLAELLTADGHKPKAMKVSAKSKKASAKKAPAVAAKVTSGKGLTDDQKADMLAKLQEQMDALLAS